MVDIIAPILALLVVVFILFRKTSPGIAIFSLLAGVMLQQSLSQWLIGLLPTLTLATKEYVALAIELLLIFTPTVVAITVIKVGRKSVILSVLTSLTLSFLMFTYGMKAVGGLNIASQYTKNSGLIHFVSPYQNTILLASVVLALFEIIVGHRHKKSEKSTKSKKN